MPSAGLFFRCYEEVLNVSTSTKEMLETQGVVLTLIDQQIKSTEHLTWVILSTETGMPSMVRGGSSEASSPPAGACSASAFSRSSNIMPLYFLTWRMKEDGYISVLVYSKTG